MTAQANGIILAGGRSNRFGEDKALVELDGSPLISHVARRLVPAVDRIVIAGREGVPSGVSLPDGVTFTPDRSAFEGPLVGIYGGLLASDAELNIIVGCDAPFVSPDLASMLIARAADSRAAVVIPEWNGRPQVLLAVYRRSCLDKMRPAIGVHVRSPQRFRERVPTLIIPAADVARIDPQGLSFFNVNTREDLRTAEAIIEKARQTS